MITSNKAKTTMAIIAEYNPFHNGHLYQINKAKEITNADYTIVVLGGSFLQRGTPALLDKYERAKMCINEGVDLVFELPFPYATGSAKDFSNGAVSLLNKLKSVDYLCFGVECDDSSLLEYIADLFYTEPEVFKLSLKSNLENGTSYPKARELALLSYFDALDGNEKYSKNLIHNTLSCPNNILAIEYLCALKACNSNIKPVFIKRLGSYHENNLSKEQSSFSSASAIRQILLNDENTENHFNELYNHMPTSVCKILQEEYQKSFPLSNACLNEAIYMSLFHKDYELDICDMTKEIRNKLTKASPYQSYEELVDDLKSKDITSSRVRRILLHLIFHYRNQDRDLFYKNGTIFYGNVLALRKDSSSILRTIKSNSELPIITKKADFKENTALYNSEAALACARMWELDTNATLFYNHLVYAKYQIQKTNDYNTALPII